MNADISNRIIALAGLYQCVELVIELAWHGHAKSDPFDVCLKSLFKLDADSYDDVYGGRDGIELGLTVLKSVLNKQGKSHTMERTRYSVMLLFLEKKLRKNAKHMKMIKDGIGAVSAQLAHFELTHANIVSQLAEIYRQAISPLGPKIIVNGEQSYLANPDIANRIRTLLLAGIRAAVLWHQAGGNRWRLLFERNAILRGIQALDT